MIGLLALVGLCLGRGLNVIIARQLRDDATAAVDRSDPWYARLPLVGALMRRAWVDLLVEVLTATMTVVLWLAYGWTLRWALLLAAVLVLIDTAAIDWKVKLIDTLIMVAATLVAVALAPVIIASHSLSPWLNSLLGLLSVGGIFVLFFVIAKILYPQQEAPFGLGDVYLGAFIGALLGLYHVGPALFYGMLLAGGMSLGMMLVLGYQRARLVPISYGTFLCLGVLLYLAQGRM